MHLRPHQFSTWAYFSALPFYHSYQFPGMSVLPFRHFCAPTGFTIYHFTNFTILARFWACHFCMRVNFRPVGDAIFTILRPCRFYHFTIFTYLGILDRLSAAPFPFASIPGPSDYNIFFYDFLRPYRFTFLPFSNCAILAHLAALPF